MSDTLWPTVFARLGLVPVGVVEDGLLYAYQAASHRLEAHYRAWRNPLTVRIVVRPEPVGESFLLVPRDKVPTAPQWRTGDDAFDDQVAILAGGRAVLHRLGQRQRQALAEVVGRLSATIGAQEATLEPAVTVRFADPHAATAAVQELVSIAVSLGHEPSIEALLQRWLREDEAPGVQAALSRRVLELLPDLTASQAELACEALIERTQEPPLSLLAAMPPYPVVLSTWFELGDPLDARISERVIEAWHSGDARPAAQYVGSLFNQLDHDSERLAVVDRLWSTPGLVEDPHFVRDLLRSLPDRPPSSSRSLLQQLHPRSSSEARRLAKVLAAFAHPESDERLTQWLRLPGSGIRRAAALALAGRVVDDLRHENVGRVRPIAQAARHSSALVAALIAAIPQEYAWWLAKLRPHGEPDAVALIQRLGEGGAMVDDTLLYWLDRGTRAVRLAAVSALTTAGSPRAIPALRERSSGWFGDGLVREQCRAAAELIRQRAGGAGNLAIAPPTGGHLAETMSGGELAED
ncbi:MAG: hypothetical protein AAGA48_05515 [Myxococcota bacterium]